LRELNEDERVNEIARMLSGEELTAAALENARDLLGQ
jgi:DNA repair protein RecN (Recombination protein N)